MESLKRQRVEETKGNSQNASSSMEELYTKVSSPDFQTTMNRENAVYYAEVRRQCPKAKLRREFVTRLLNERSLWTFEEFRRFVFALPKVIQTEYYIPRMLKHPDRFDYDYETSVLYGAYVMFMGLSSLIQTGFSCLRATGFKKTETQDFGFLVGIGAALRVAKELGFYQKTYTELTKVVVCDTYDVERNEKFLPRCIHQKTANVPIDPEFFMKKVTMALAEQVNNPAIYFADTASPFDIEQWLETIQKKWPEITSKNIEKALPFLVQPFEDAGQLALMFPEWSWVGEAKTLEKAQEFLTHGPRVVDKPLGIIRKYDDVEWSCDGKVDPMTVHKIMDDYQNIKSIPVYYVCVIDDAVWTPWSPRKIPTSI